MQGLAAVSSLSLAGPQCYYSGACSSTEICKQLSDPFSSDSFSSQTFKSSTVLMLSSFLAGTSARLEKKPRQGSGCFPFARVDDEYRAFVSIPTASETRAPERELRLLGGSLFARNSHHKIYIDEQFTNKTTEVHVTCQRCTADNKILDLKNHRFCRECGWKLTFPKKHQTPINHKQNLGYAFVQIHGVDEAVSVSEYAPRYRVLIKLAEDICERYAITLKYLNGGKLMLVSGLASQKDNAEQNLLRLVTVLKDLESAFVIAEPKIRLTSSIDTGEGYQDEDDLFGMAINRAQRQLQFGLTESDDVLGEHSILVSQEAITSLSFHYSSSLVALGVKYKGFNGVEHVVYALGQKNSSVLASLPTDDERKEAVPKCSQKEYHHRLGDHHCTSCGVAYKGMLPVEQGTYQYRVVLAVDMSGFTSLITENGPRHVAEKVGQFVREIEYEVAKEGGQIENIIHRAGDEIALSLSYGDFAKMLRATIKAFRRLERRHPEIKIKAAFALCDLMEYADGIKIGNVSIAQRAQSQAGDHGIVVHQNLVDRIPLDIEQSDRGEGESHSVITGVKANTGFIVTEGFTPQQRTNDAVTMVSFYQEHVHRQQQFAAMAYVGGRDTGKAMGLAGFMERLDPQATQVLHGSAFRYQRDPIRNALMHHVASFDLDELTPEALDSFLTEIDFFGRQAEDKNGFRITEKALDGFLGEIDFFGEHFQNNYESPKRMVRELLAYYLGCAIRDESEEIKKLKKDARLFLTEIHRVVAHVVGRMAVKKESLIFVLFNLDYLRKDQSARALFSLVAKYNRLKPVFVIGLEDTIPQLGDDETLYWHQFFGTENKVTSKVLIASALNREAIEKALVYFSNKEGLRVHHVSDAVVDYFVTSRADLQVIKALLQSHIKEGIVRINENNVLVFAEGRPLDLSTREVDAIHLSALERLSAQEQSVFKTISMLVGDDVVFYEEELPQYDEAALGAVALARILTSLKEQGYLASEGARAYRVARMGVKQAIQTQEREGRGDVAIHKGIVSYLKTRELKTARDHALLAYHLTRMGKHNEAYDNYHRAAKISLEPSTVSVALIYYREMERLLGHFTGLDRLVKYETLLQERMKVYREMINVVKGTDPWWEDIQAYVALRDDAAFTKLSLEKQEEIILNGLAIFPGEHWLKQRPNEVAAFYNRVEEQEAVFIASLSPVLRVKFHIRAMGACQMINAREQQDAADVHVQKAIALIVGDEGATIKDHERVFASSILLENPRLFERICLNIASRYSVHGPDFAAALPYVHKAIELYDRAGNQMMVCYAQMTLGINMNNQGQYEAAEQALEGVYTRGNQMPFVKNFALLHMVVSAIKQGQWDKAMQRIEEIDLNYGPLIEDKVAHQALVIAHEAPETLNGFLRQQMGLDLETKFEANTFQNKSRREPQLFLALYLANRRLGHHTLAQTYLHYAREHFETVGHVEDFNEVFLWLEQNEWQWSPSAGKTEGNQPQVLVFY